MKRIEITKAYVKADTIHYEIREEAGLGLLRKDIVELYIRLHHNESTNYDLSSVPESVLLVPISLYLLPITYFYNVELVIPSMDKVLYENLQPIYEAYSNIYGPFKREWRGKVTVGKIVENKPVENSQYDKVVFFSGGVDACHAGINNPGRKSLLVSIPDIESMAKSDGPLREEKFTLIKDFSKVVNSEWLLLSNNFNSSLYNGDEIKNFLTTVRGLCSEAYNFDGWAGIKYMANMCCVAPVAYLTGVKSLIMGSGFEQIEDELRVNYDGANPDITNSIKFADVSFAEQDGLTVRRSKKVSNIIDWCKAHKITTRLWACFTDGSTQCGYCTKCIRTQINILCAGENPRDWGFVNFSEGGLTDYVKDFKYKESNPCWNWDNIETIDENKIYPYCNELLHWLKTIGYKEYHHQVIERSKPTTLTRLLAFRYYPHYIKMVFSKFVGRK